MNWTALVWTGLYFAAGWFLTACYELEDDLWKLLIFLGWPVLIAGFLVILVLLVLFSLMLMAEEIGCRLRRKGSGPAGKERKRR